MSTSITKTGILIADGVGVGENLILNGNMAEFDDSYIAGATYHWSSWANATDRTLVELDGKKWLHYKSAEVGKYGGFNQDNNNTGDVIRIKPNTNYTVSAVWFASESVKCTFWFHLRSSEGGANIRQVNKNFDVTTSPARYFYIFNSGSNSTYTINRFNLMIGSYQHTVADVDVYFTDVKVEEGSIATPWLPNVNDALYVGSELGFDEASFEGNARIASGYMQAREFYED